MLIQTLSRQLMVIRVLWADRDTEVQVCRDLQEPPERRYIVVRVKNPKLAYQVIPLFLNAKQDACFTDFVEAFSQNGDFYALFVSNESPPLFEQLAATPRSTLERLEIGKSLFTRIALLRMAPGFQYEALADDNLLVDNSLSVSFRYCLRSMGSYATLSELAVQARLANILQRLFQPELEKQYCPQLHQFIDKLATEPYGDAVAMYGDYHALYLVMRELEEKGLTAPQNFWFRAWERIKKLGKYVRPAIACLLVAAAFGYLVYTLLAPPPATGQSTVVFKEIGTVEVY